MYGDTGGDHIPSLLEKLSEYPVSGCYEDALWQHDMTGYEVTDLDATLTKARAAGAAVIVPAQSDGDRQTAIVRFPGGYIAEIHSGAAR